MGHSVVEIADVFCACVGDVSKENRVKLLDRLETIKTVCGNEGLESVSNILADDGMQISQRILEAGGELRHLYKKDNSVFSFLLD